MRTQNFRLVVRQSEITGELGWCLKHLDWTDPSIAGGLAHDILEHRKTDTGRFDEEVRAFGAMLSTRRGTQYLYDHAIGDDLVEKMGSELGQGTVLNALSNAIDFSVKPKVIPKKDSAEEQEIIGIAQAAAYEAMNEVGEFESDEDFDEQALKISDWMTAWMIKGYRWACHKYDRWGWARGGLYTVLVEELHRELFKHRGGPDVYEECLIKMNPDRCWVDIRVIEPTYEEY